MIQHHFKTAWRHLWKNKGFTLLNLLGLAIGFAGFILSYQYINRETSYDRWNTHIDHIYLVGLSYQGNLTDQTPPSLAPILMEEFPEVEAAGRVFPNPYGSFPIFGKETALAKNAVFVDSAAAAIFEVWMQDGRLWGGIPARKEAAIVNRQIADILFDPDSLPSPDAPVSLHSYSIYQEMYENIYGIAQERKLSHLYYDILFIKPIGDENETGNPFTYQTFVRVAPGTDIQALTTKITKLYQTRISKHKVVQASAFANGKIYLDPLKNLHLQPRHGSDTPYITIWVLGILSIVILVLAGINFTNLTVAQADQRAKEIGVKKLFGVGRTRIGLQLLVEVFCLCLIAALIAWGMLILSSNALQKWFNEDIRVYILHRDTIFQLAGAVLVTTCLAGIYPALTLSAFRPIGLLRGHFQTGHTRTGFRNALLTFQLVIACTFISGIMVINAQLDYMRSAERGFEPAQVINFKGMGLYYPVHSGWKTDLSNRLKESGLITHVATTTDAPGDHKLPPKMQFSHIDRTLELEHIAADLDFFELLSIPTLQGRSILSEAEFVKDSLSHFAVLNESAARQMGLSDPIGTTLRGCDADFTIIGIVADSKIQGFERPVSPAIYTFKEECSGRYKNDIMIKTAAGKTREAIQLIENEWTKNPNANLLPLEYEYLDQKYERLHMRQKQLQQASGGFVVISLLIAGIGLFGMSAYNIAIRRKEMGIRKVLGASLKQLFLQLNRPFLRMFILANLIAVPVAYLLTSKWLDNFAYKIQLNAWPYLLSGLMLFVIIVATIFFQSIKAARSNPVDSLRDE